MFRNMTDSRLRMLIAIVLIVITFASYWQVLTNKFVNYDDDHYVYKNPRVQDGLSGGSIVWALKSTSNANWHPLTWISHMVDCEIYRMKPWGHHLTNLLLHIASTLLLFLLLTRLTGCTWRSGFVAALFAIHPLHVESVAWAAERKDVLSTFFFMLTLLAYVRYAESPNWKRYLLVAGSFLLGLSAKPMLVTLPLVLLLLDYWPLHRFSQSSGTKKKQQSGLRVLIRLAIEKAPFFAMTVGSCIITVIAQSTGSAITSIEKMPLGERLTTAVAGYAAYILQMVWPLRLGVIYPHPSGNMPAWQIAGSVLLLGAISYLVYRQRKSQPYLVAGWLWFVITLVPVIGLVQVGAQFIADRYTYIPLIGLFVALTWGVAERMEERENGSTRASKSPAPQLSRSPVLCLPALLIVTLCVLTYRQVGYWKDSFTLFTHTLEVTAPSAAAYTNLGIAYADRGDQDTAISLYEKAIGISPDHVNARYNMGNAYVRKKMFPEAIEQYQMAIELKPDSAEAHANLGNAFSDMGLYDQAEAEYKKVLSFNSEYLPAITNLGNMYKNTGRFPEAEEMFRKALEIRPQDTYAHSNLGVAFAGQGMIDEAVPEFQRALEISPKNAEAHVNMANVYAGRHEFDKAADEYKLAISLRPRLLEAHHNLGLVLRTKGDMRGAIEEFRKAVDIDPRMPVPHVSLATALYGAGDYAGAWEQIHLCEANHGRPPEQFVAMLSAKMPDPGR